MQEEEEKAEEEEAENEEIEEEVENEEDVTEEETAEVGEEAVENEEVKESLSGDVRTPLGTRVSPKDAVLSDRRDCETGDNQKATPYMAAGAGAMALGGAYAAIRNRRVKPEILNEIAQEKAKSAGSPPKKKTAMDIIFEKKKLLRDIAKEVLGVDNGNIYKDGNKLCIELNNAGRVALIDLDPQNKSVLLATRDSDGELCYENNAPEMPGIRKFVKQLSESSNNRANKIQTAELSIV